MSSVFSLSRRQAIKLFGLSAGALVIGSRSSSAQDTGSTLHRLNNFVAIHEDNTVEIICQRSDMGQGVRTTFAMVIADELDVEWKQVRVVQADGDEKYGNQDTDGSFSIRVFWEGARQMGATARAMLISAAALDWKVKEEDCTARGGFVTHAQSGQKRSYGSLAAKAALLKPPKLPKLKSESEFKYIGKKCKSFDCDDIVTGKAIYGIDIDIPAMLYASIERSPAIGGKVGKVNDAAALKVPGVKAVVKLDAQPADINTPAGVAVIATNTWAALKGREKLVVGWDLSGANKDSDADRIRDLKAGFQLPAKVIRNDGNIATAKVASTYKTDFYAPYLAHATMEAPCATAHVTAKGCEIWAATQHPQRLRKSAAKVLGIDEKHVAVHVTLLGGGFGRKSQPDFGIEAVMLSQKVKKPVKVLFTREDDIRHDFYHADSYQEIEVGLDDKGMPITWHHKTAFPTYMTVFDPNAKEQSDPELDMGATNIIYDIPNIKVEGFCVKSPVKVGWFRSVKNIFHAFAVNTVIDELAERARVDPVAYRLKLLERKRVLSNEHWDKDTPIKQETERMANLIRKVAAQANWDKATEKGVYRGFASHYSFLTYTAAAITIAVDGSGIKVKRVDIGIDCGYAVNPDVIVAQMQGSAIYGMSLALHQQINLKDGAVQQSNFHDYPVVRMPECPEIHVYVAQNHHYASGVGEPGVPPIAPAIAAAIYKATGKRLHNLPLRL